MHKLLAIVLSGKLNINSYAIARNKTITNVVKLAITKRGLSLIARFSIYASGK